MNCLELFNAAGFHCQKMEQEHGGPVFHLSTPLRTFDGDGIRLFAEMVGPAVRFFDAGYTIFHMLSSGIQLKDGRSMAPIKRLVDAAGAELSEDGEISALALPNQAHDAARKVLSAIMATTAWESDNVGLPADGVTLATEVEFFLRQWKPLAKIEKGQKRAGISGREYEFDFLFDGRLVDVVASRPQSTAAKVRKLADVTAIPSQEKLDMLIIIDDRADQEQAKQEAAILRQFAPTQTVTWLQHQASTTPIPTI